MPSQETKLAPIDAAMKCTVEGSLRHPGAPTLVVWVMSASLPPALAAAGSHGSHASPVYMDLFTNNDCSGVANLTVDLVASNSTRCGASLSHGFGSMKLRGNPSALVAVNGNCVGKFAYLGGWSGRDLGGVVRPSDGCHRGVGSAMVSCTGTVDGMQDDLLEVCGHPLPAPPVPATSPVFAVLSPGDYKAPLGTDFQWAQQQIPFLDLDPATDPGGAIMATYYYRCFTC
eukprot:gene8798-7983_t